MGVTGRIQVERSRNKVIVRERVAGKNDFYWMYYVFFFYLIIIKKLKSL